MKTIYLLLISFVVLYANNFKEILLLQINNPYVLDSYRNDEVAVAYCKKGDIDYFAEKNIIEFFKKAKEYGYIPLAGYCTYPCVITGKVKLDSRIYDFELNEGGYAVLKGKNEERYFGDEKLYGECGI